MMIISWFLRKDPSRQEHNTTIQTMSAGVEERIWIMEHVIWLKVFVKAIDNTTSNRVWEAQTGATVSCCSAV